MKFSLVALFATVAAAVPNVVGRNPPMIPCDTQLQGCLEAGTEAAECQQRQKNCLGYAEAAFNSCNNASGIPNKDECWSRYEASAGHRREGDPRA